MCTSPNQQYNFVQYAQMQISANVLQYWFYKQNYENSLNDDDTDQEI